MRIVEILGIKVANPTFNESLNAIKRFISGSGAKHVVTLNPEILMSAQENAELKAIINNADLVIPDGIGLVWAIKSIYKIPVERVTGVDIAWTLAKICQKNGWSIFFLGAGTGVAEKTAKILKEKYPNLNIAGTFAGKPVFTPNRPQFNFPYDLRILDIKQGHKDKNLDIVNIVHKTKPDILLVAYGHPKQEKFISRYKRLLGAKVLIGVGGAFDFICNNISRAPVIFQKLGLEWLWRLIHEPWRANRIITATIRFPWALITRKK